MTAIESTRHHIAEFVERPHAAFGNQPVCPFARAAQKQNRVSFVSVPFGPTDATNVGWAVEAFLASQHDVLLVIHPDAASLTFAELDELRERFARQYAGRLAVFTGHPNDPYTLAGVRTRIEPHPTLHFVRSGVLHDAELRLSGRRRVLGRAG